MFIFEKVIIPSRVFKLIFISSLMITLAASAQETNIGKSNISSAKLENNGLQRIFHKVPKKVKKESF